jgi:hypothetical protein
MAKAQKCTGTELELRLQQVSEWLCEGRTIRAIQRLCLEQWDVHSRQARRYVTIVQNRINEDLSIDRQVQVARSIRIYERVINDRQARHRDVIVARSKIDRLLGIAVDRVQIDMKAEMNTRQALSAIDWDSLCAAAREINAMPQQPIPEPVPVEEPPPIGPRLEPELLIKAAQQPSKAATPWTVPNGEAIGGHVPAL